MRRMEKEVSEEVRESDLETAYDLGDIKLFPKGQLTSADDFYDCGHQCTPPKNRVVERLATTMVSRKSVRKNIPNFIPLYSTKYPMISDSPSGRSKGTRFVSARAAVTKTKNAMGCVTMPHLGIHPPINCP